MNDPTRTKTRRAKALSRVTKIFKYVSRHVYENIISSAPPGSRKISPTVNNNDLFKEVSPFEYPNFTYKYDDIDIDEFERWVKSLFQIQLLDSSQIPPWLKFYIRSSYASGALKSATIVGKGEQNFNSPENIFSDKNHARTVAILYQRMYDQLDVG